MSTETQGLRVIGLQVENFKRLSAVGIKPSKGLNVISGRNAQGKSSVLDAIVAAVGGKAASPAMPIREGRTRANVVVDLGDLVVIREWSASGRNVLTVAGKDGEVKKSPQAILDSLVGRLTFDPLEFSRMKPAEQASTLRDLAGLDLSELDGNRKQLYDERTAVGRDLKSMLAALKATPFHSGIGTENKSAAEVTQRLVDAREAHAQQRKAMAEVKANEKAVADAEAAVDRARKELKRAEALRAEKLEELEASKAAVEAFETTPPPELEPITAELQGIEDFNRKAEANRSYKARSVEADKAEAKVNNLTAQLEAIDREKAAILAGAKFPLEGLAVDGDMVIYRGRPLEQASSAEQLKIGLAIGAALNPTLRIVMVRDGSLLDEESLCEVHQWAEDNDFQVWLEKVGDLAGTVVIEDGTVAGQPAPENEAEAWA